MELYTNNENRTVFLDAPLTAESGSIVVTIERDDVVLHTFNTVDDTDGVYSVIVPYAFIQHDNSFYIHWTFSYVEDGETYDFDSKTLVEVVTPYLTASEIDILADGALSDSEINDIEKAVRHIINAHTGQSFGRFIGTKTATGDGGTGLSMPARLINLEKINGVDAKEYFKITGDGWYLKYFVWGSPPVKADYYGLHQHAGGVIHNPDNVKYGHFDGDVYDIDGVWGWDSIPAPVREAAKLLINDYACGDSNYRDRYLTSMTAADWRIQFNAGAFAKTGNVRADQLLSNYVVKRGWAVI